MLQGNDSYFKKTITIWSDTYILMDVCMADISGGADPGGVLGGQDILVLNSYPSPPSFRNPVSAPGLQALTGKKQ